VPVVYVEVSDPHVSKDELLEWARKDIGERAAIPKDIHIINGMPLTAVGKIFKPALRWDAAARVYQEELETLGDLVESVEVIVSEHKIHGAGADIRIKAAAGIDRGTIAAKVRDILARYTVHYDIIVE
jgi:fatty-acyl-CoA synthase